MDFEMPCPLPGCTEVVRRSAAIHHVRRMHPELTKRKERVACPKCTQALQGENYTRHYVAHFPSYVCPYGCGASLSRVTVSERKRHYSGCGIRLRTGLTWEEADALAMQNESLPVSKKTNREGGSRTMKQYVETTEGPVAVEDLEAESEEECLSTFVKRKQRQSAPASEPAPEGIVESESDVDDSQGDTSVEMNDAKT
ncbi:uncharacterized protein PHACADRAFT_260854 [Phanerochaete carnosa HHB-10118-sp]|uniref:Uncharacterized protein n=1 Tax=Phanerochaete carnosa (strain HHB-10118-sp) TaxID=650164 RepID=K5W045_PHACS|nr:uncharacterized protein PHACADRAFT_260854 [Phanerochaete carnosa HHB-10118-sp]EKM52455.1 hypothetical protein PHACADRAFT_260854 [Phanerochaete carnosa HHB-10118-sp]